MGTDQDERVRRIEHEELARAAVNPWPYGGRVPEHAMGSMASFIDAERRRVCLEHAESRMEREDLAVYVRDLYPVEINDAYMPDPAPRDRLERVAPHGPYAADRDALSSESLHIAASDEPFKSHELSA